MRNLVTFNATEARQNFFQLLKLVEKGDEAIIVKKDQDLRFKIILDNKAKSTNKELLLKEIRHLGLKSMPIKKMKAVFSSLHDL